jgi:hypothetical protein
VAAQAEMVRRTCRTSGSTSRWSQPTFPAGSKVSEWDYDIAFTVSIIWRSALGVGRASSSQIAKGSPFNNVEAIQSEIDKLFADGAVAFLMRRGEIAKAQKILSRTWSRGYRTAIRPQRCSVRTWSRRIGVNDGFTTPGSSNRGLTGR